MTLPVWPSAIIRLAVADAVVGRHMPNRGPTNVSPGRSCDTENRL